MESFLCAESYGCLADLHKWQFPNFPVFLPQDDTDVNSTSRRRKIFIPGSRRLPGIGHCWIIEVETGGLLRFISQFEKFLSSIQGILSRREIFLKLSPAA
jgi:hypothetical protein